MALYRGQEVVCIDDDGFTRKYVPVGYVASTFSDEMDGLKKGRKYTIREVGAFRDILWCRLEEIVRPSFSWDGKEAVYNQARFRPVKKVTTDISIFTSMLTKVPEEVK